MLAACAPVAAQQPTPASPLPASRVLVVYNATEKESRRVARYYMERRGVPAANLCALRPPEDESGETDTAVLWPDLEKRIRQPIRKCVEALGRQAILYIVFSYRTPYRLAGPSPRSGMGISIDQWVADLWDEAGPGSPVRNPYYAPTQLKAGVFPPFVSLTDYRRQPDARLVYSVWRLDAPTEALARALVDRALDAERRGAQGQGCFDRRLGNGLEQAPDRGIEAGDWDILRAAQAARAAGFTVLEDTHAEEFGTPPAPRRCENALLYAGWYTLNHYNDAFSWAPGAIGVHLDSDSAADPRGGENWTANAVRAGITATSGSLNEPYLEGLVHPAGLFRNLFEGASAGDAFLRNTARLKWMIVNIGDPLYRPFPGGRPGFR